MKAPMRFCECFWGEGSTVDCCNFPWDLSEHLGSPWWCQLAKKKSQLSGWVQVMCSVTTHFKRLDTVFWWSWLRFDRDAATDVDAHAWHVSRILMFLCVWCFFLVLIQSLCLQQALLSELWTWFWCSSWSAPCAPTRILASKSSVTDVVFQPRSPTIGWDDRCFTK